MKRLLVILVFMVLVVEPALAISGTTVSTGCDAQGNPLKVQGVPIMFIHTQKQTLIPGVHCDPEDSRADPIIIKDETLTEGILESDVGETKNVDRLLSNITTIYYPDLPNGGLKEYDSKMYLTTAIGDGIYEKINSYRTNVGLEPVVYSAAIELDVQTWLNETDETPQVVTHGNVGSTMINPNNATYLIGKDAGFKVVDGWFKEHILNPNFTKVGIGFDYNDTTYEYVAVALFGNTTDAKIVSTVTAPEKIVSTSVPKPVSTVAPTIPVSNTSIVDAVVRFTNEERAAANLSPLKLDPALSAVAQGHSTDMSTNGYFNHTAPDGHDLSDRLDAAGYEYSAAGENIARSNYYTLSSNFTAVGEYFVDLWMDSPGHRKNILTPEFTLIGVGVAWNNSTGYTLTQDFADKPDLVEATKVTPVPTQVPTVVQTPKPTPIPAPVLPAPTLVVPDLQKIVNPTTPVPTTVVPTPTPVPTAVPTVAPTPAPATVFVPEPTFVTDFAPYTGEEGDAVVAGFWDSFVTDMFGWM